MRLNVYQPSRSDTREVKQNSKPAGSVENISHLGSKLQEKKPLQAENMVHQTFLRRQLGQQESNPSSQNNERQEIKHTVVQPVLSPKYSSIKSTSDPVSPPDQISKRQDATAKLSIVSSPNPKNIQENLSQQTKETANPATSSILTKPIPHARTSKPGAHLGEHPPVESKSAKGEIESHDVDPQDSMLNQPALSSELSLSQSSFKFPDDKTGNQQKSNRKPPVKSKKKFTAMSSNLGFLKEAFAKQVKIEELSQDDVIVAVMGPTGSGKSTFIKFATGLDTGVGHTLESCTSEIKIFKLSVPELADGDIVFVDTPGFDDTHKSDADILKMVADWLKTTYEKEILLSGLLYFHRISDNRMAGTPLKNLRMFEQLCGKNAFHNVILTTTMWDEVDMDTGCMREEELKSNYWQSMIERNSTTSRFMRSRESALGLIEPLIDAANKKSSLLLQQEMVDMRNKLPATSAGLRLFSEMELLVRERQDALERIRNAMKYDDASLPALNKEYQRLKMQLDITATEMQKLRLPLGKRLSRMSRKWFTFKFSF